MSTRDIEKNDIKLFSLMLLRFRLQTSFGPAFVRDVYFIYEIFHPLERDLSQKASLSSESIRANLSSCFAFLAIGCESLASDATVSCVNFSMQWKLPSPNLLSECLFALIELSIAVSSGTFIRMIAYAYIFGSKVSILV